MAIKTRQFTLRPFREGDEKSLQKNINDKAICRYTLRIPYPYTSKHAKNWVRVNTARSKKNFHRLVIDIDGEVAGRVYANVRPGNKASVRVLKKNGFTKEGRLRKAGFKGGKSFDVLMYAKVK